MNKKFSTPGKLLLIASVLCCGSLNAQTLCDTTYRISSGIVDAAWLTPPANTQRASMVNKFRWLNQSFPMKHLVFTSTPSIESPYFQYLNSNVTNLALPSDTLKLDFRPEDGWELIKRDFGYNVDGTPAATGVVNPSFIIYNKYTGTLRVFVARGELNNQANRAVIGINFPATSGLPSSMQTSALDLGLGNGPVALDQSFFKKDSSFYYSPVNYISSYFKWMYADFPITYDPCTCFYTSMVQVKTDLINYADINLSGALSGKIETINNGTSSQTDSEYDKFRKTYGQISGIGKKFVEGSAGISDFINKYKKTVDSSKSGTLIQKADKIFALTNIAQILNKSRFLKAGLNTVPFIKTAFNIMDFFIGGGKSSKGTDSIALMPLSINMDLTVKGSLTTNVNVLRYDFLNPGSLSASVNDNFYPFYNNTMGVFNLLSTPRINFSKRDTSFVSDFCYRGVCRSYLEIRSYQFAKPIKYVLNPSSGLEIATDSATGKPDIQIALVIPRGIPAGNSTTATDPWISENANMKWNYDARNEKDQVLEFSTFYNFASCIGDSVYSIVKSTDTTRGQLFYPNLQKAYVRVMANLKRKNGLGQNVLFVAKYPAAIDTLSALSKFRKPVVNCDGTVFSAAPFSEINTFCTNNTSAYVKSDRFRRASNTDTSVAPINYSDLFKVNLYPNPASNQFTLTTEYSLSDIIAVDIYDIAGKMIKRVAARQYIPAGLHAQTINVSTMPNGMYYLKITGQKNGNLLKNIPFIIIKN